MNSNTQNERYFAATNSYNGFISFFDKIFNSTKNNRIFVLKGGPGTGKSSLMRKIETQMNEHGCKCTEILCSSDTKSLDGIIISYGDKSISILDGTAPHERDAKIPGAVDEIIDLGACWDKEWLCAKRDTIESLSLEKSRAYSTAYSYLKIAGSASDFIYSIYSKVFNKSKAKFKAESIIKDLKVSTDAEQELLMISAFGKDGDTRLDTLEKMVERRITVGNNRYLTSLFLNEFGNVLKENDIPFIHLPMALDPQQTDCIFIRGGGILLCYGIDGEINTNELLSACSIENEQIKCAESIIKIAKEEAKRWFNIASDFHFRLEEIYIQAMHFDKIDEIIEDKIKEIRLILDL
jgi:hypothetical protein